MTDTSDAFQLPADLANAKFPELHARVIAMNLGDDTRRALAEEMAAVEDDPDPTMLGSVEHRLKQFTTRQQDDEAGRACNLLLRSLWRLIRASQDVGAQREIERAVDDLREAAFGFATLGQSEERDNAIGLGLYTEALLQLRQGNSGACSTLVDDARKFLAGACEFESQFELQVLVDGMEVDALVLQAQKAYFAGLPRDAEGHLLTASRKAGAIASRFDDGEEATSSYWLGLARLYEAYASFLDAFVCLASYAFDRIPADLPRAAKEAHEFLTRSAFPGHPRALAAFFTEALEMVEELARMMTKVFMATFKPDVGSFDRLHARVDAARAAIAGEGPDLLPLMRSCDMLEDQLNNLERLVKPKPRDFGIFSGVVACAMFAPLLAIVAFVNKVFSLGADANLVLWTCIVLALVAGFGYGAVKFRSLLPGAK